MRFDRIKARNIGPFKSVDVNIGEISGQLVAVVGANGAGKTTLLELLSGCLFRQCPTRGTLASLATARDSFVEVSACNGAPYTVRQTVDALSAKGETLILDAAGTPLTDSGKVRDGDRWIAAHFPSPAVLYTSSIAVQGRRGFLDLSKSERRQVLSSMVGIERYEQLAEGARERAKTAKVAIEVLRARFGETPAPDMADLANRVELAQAQVVRAGEALHGARVALDRARAAAGDAARAAELAEQRRAALARQVAASGALEALELKLRNNRAVLADAAAIREAVEKAAALDATLEGAKAHAAETKAALSVARAAGLQAADAAKRAAADVRTAVARVDAVQQRLADREAVEAAAARVEQLRRQEAELAERVGESERQAAELETLVLGGKDQRIAGLRHVVEEIGAADDEDAPLTAWARTALVTDDELATRAGKAPEELAAMRRAAQAGRAVLDTLRADARSAERLAARAGEMAQAEKDLAGAEAGLEAAKTLHVEAVAAMEAAAIVTHSAGELSNAAQASVTALTGEREGLGALLAKQAPLENAQARIEELEAMLTPARSALEAADAELASLPAVTAEVVDVAKYEGDAARAQAGEHEARAAHTRAQDAVVKGSEQEIKREALWARQVEAASELADWTRLGQDLGRDGLQALELDAALPEITELANDLLHRCHGSRFTVELRTDRLSADGKKTVEDLELRVIDSVRGRDEDASTYSGGECVIVGEAVSLALTVIACRRSGIERPTLLRDETGAALDQENGRAYMAMLRMAARQIGADHVLFVTHVPELQDLADARITVSADGKVEVAA